MKQAKRAQAIVEHRLHVGVETLIEGQLMDVRGGENLRAQQQRGDRQRAPSGPVSKTALRSLLHSISRARHLGGWTPTTQLP